MANEAYPQIVDKKENEFVGKPLLILCQKRKLQWSPLLMKSSLVVILTMEPNFQLCLTGMEKRMLPILILFTRPFVKTMVISPVPLPWPLILLNL